MQPCVGEGVGWLEDEEDRAEVLGLAGGNQLEGCVWGSGGGGRQSVLRTSLERRWTIPWCCHWKWLVSAAASQCIPRVRSSSSAHCGDATLPPSRAARGGQCNVQDGHTFFRGMFLDGELGFCKTKHPTEEWVEDCGEKWKEQLGLR